MQPKAEINDLRNTRSGACYLLGCGPSLNDFQPLPGVDLLGLNRSWLYYPEAKDRFIVDAANYQDLQTGRQGCPAPERLWVPLPRVAPTAPNLGPRAANTTLITVTHLVSPRKRPTFRLDLDVGTYAPFCGLFALECAVWLGYTDIRLVAWDGKDKSHFFKDESFGQKSVKVTSALSSAWSVWMLDAARQLEDHRPLVKVRHVTPTAFDVFPTEVE